MSTEIEKKRFFSDKIDMTLLVCCLLAALIGIITVNSASASLSGHVKYVVVQSIAFVLGCGLMTAIIFFRYTYLEKIRYLIFAIGLVLLIAVLIIGKTTSGTQGWFVIGPISLQPSEIAKICFIITLSSHLSAVLETVSSPKTLLFLVLHLLFYIIPVLLQPDFGTASVFAVIFVCELFFAGVSHKYFLGAIGILLVSSPVAWFLLADYQKKRIITLFNPESDPLGSGYHVLQSQLAIGSGQITGRGYMQGPQTQYGYLPERQTDFAFSVIGEEFGFIGTMFVTILLFIIVYRCFDNARSVGQSDSFGEFLCAGVGAMLFFHILENIGMCIGLMPITGIPLPFISYGGSNLVTCFAAIGLVQSVRMRRRFVKFNL